jgi:hypothetical protein
MLIGVITVTEEEFFAPAVEQGYVEAMNDITQFVVSLLEKQGGKVKTKTVEADRAKALRMTKKTILRLLKDWPLLAARP